MTQLQIRALCASVWSYCDRLTDAGRERSEAMHCGMYYLMRMTYEGYILPQQKLVPSIKRYLTFLNHIASTTELMLPGPRQLTINFEG